MANQIMISTTYGLLTKYGEGGGFGSRDCFWDDLGDIWSGPGHDLDPSRHLKSCMGG